MSWHRHQDKAKDVRIILQGPRLRLRLTVLLNLDAPSTRNLAHGGILVTLAASRIRSSKELGGMASLAEQDSVETWNGWNITEYTLHIDL